MGVETATPPPAGLDHMDSSSFESNQLEASLPVAGSGGCANGAATKLQKVYRGYRTRRKLADGSLPVAGSGGCVNEAATKLQKVYRGYRTRRKLADSAAVVELWWQVLEFAQLSHSTVSFDDPKPETGASR